MVRTARCPTYSTISPDRVAVGSAPIGIGVGCITSSRSKPTGAARNAGDTRLSADARGRDGGVREQLAAGVVLRSGGRSAFGGKLENIYSFRALLVLTHNGPRPC